MFVVREDLVQDEKGAEFSRLIVEHRGAVVILPKTNTGTLLLIKQYRYAVRDTILEFPAGTLEVGEQPLATAKREIQEEAGFAAKKWTELGKLYPSPGFCDEIQYLFLAEDLSASKLTGDEDEEIEVVEFTVAEVEQAIISGGLADAKSIAAFTRARLSGLL